MDPGSKRILSLDQRLRLAAEWYGKILGIEKFYERVKKHEWRVKSCKDRSDKWKERKLSEYKAGIDALEGGLMDKSSEVLRLYLLHCKLPRKPCRKNSK